MTDGAHDYEYIMKGEALFGDIMSVIDGVGHIVCLDLPNQEIYLEGNTDVQYSVG
jgi:hypothetical protein